MNNKNAREHILDLLVEIEKEGSYAQLLLKQALKDQESKDKVFITEIVYGTLKHRLKIDYIINFFSKTPVNKMKPVIKNLLRMSVYQMFYLDKVPVSAVINEAVKIAKKRKFMNLAGFVNGVLRQIERNKDAVVYPDKDEDLTAYLSISYSMPEWIIKNWLLSYDIETTERICAALNKRARVCIRINTLKADKNQVQEALKKEKISYEEGALLDEAMYIDHPGSLAQLQSFQEGLWTVQDESAMLTAHVVDPKPGEKILDMCSAPGGKSIHMAALMQNKGEIISTDVHDHKIELIEKNADRMGAHIIHAALQDGTESNPDFIEAFDRVLLDAPCSGLGILKRKPDIRYSKTPEDISEIAQLQKRLAAQAVRYIKEGGTLVYSTCTLSREENEEVARYIQEDLGLELSDIADTIPIKLRPFMKNKGSIHILPYAADTDGFFIACFKKKRIEG